MFHIPALRHRDFVVFWVGILVSLTGYMMGLVVRGWVVNQLTHSPFWLGATYAAAGIPEVLLAPVAGAVVDRFDRKRILVITQVLHAVNALGMAAALYTQVISVPLVVLFALFHGTIATFDWTVRLTVVPNLVPKDALNSAVAVSSGAWISAGIFGPVVGGMLLPKLGATGCFLLTGLSFIPIALLASTIKPLPPAQAQEGEPWFRSTFVGYRYVFKHDLLRVLFALEAVPIVLGLPYASLLPLFADTLAPGTGSGNEQTLGWLHTGAGVGAMVGVLSVALSRRLKKRGLMLVLTAVLFGTALFAFGGSTSLYASLGILVFVGCVESIYGTLNSTLIQLTADEEFRGRVMSIYNLIWGLTPIGGMSLGLLATRFGAGAAVQIHGGIVACAVLLLTFLHPRVRALD